jgi:methylated-DNA-protein-cysteine methyltransferase-like protein
MGKNSRYQQIYQMVRRIPRGKVATYGQIARLVGLAGHARQVGYALHRLPSNSNCPWHRVVNFRGMISLRPHSTEWHLQYTLLQAEGIRFDERNVISLPEFQWKR